MEDITKVVIVGDEELGTKISGLLYRAGLNVTLRTSDDLEELADAGMLLESLSGTVEVKSEVLSKCDEKVSPDTILATTASCGITEIAAATRRPEKVIGLNFVFNPFQDASLVQIVKGLETSDETVETCANLLKSTGVTTIEVADSPGLVLDRVMASVLNEAATMHVTKVATVEDIDRITKSCLNWPMGPFEFADIIGIDNVLATLEVLYREEGARFLPCRLLRQMVAMGRLGRKTCKGFYTYEQKG